MSNVLFDELEAMINAQPWLLIDRLTVGGSETFLWKHDDINNYDHSFYNIVYFEMKKDPRDQ